MSSPSEQLIADIKILAADVEQLIRATADQSTEKVAAAREKAKAALGEVQVRLSAAERVLETKARDAARATDTYVHEHPWGAIGFTAGVALVIGLLIGRR